VGRGRSNPQMDTQKNEALRVLKQSLRSSLIGADRIVCLTVGPILCYDLCRTANWLTLIADNIYVA
jgi:hypothetical protein